MIESWGWPQWTIAVLYVLIVVMTAFLHGTPKSPSKHDFSATTLGILGMAAILYFGGFWTP